MVYSADVSVQTKENICLYCLNQVLDQSKSCPDKLSSTKEILFLPINWAVGLVLCSEVNPVHSEIYSSCIFQLILSKFLIVVLL